MVTTGVRGGWWRADVTPWGALHPWDGAPLDWYVAADDRWHAPRLEPSIRQRRLDGTPVVETRLRIPGGDAVQRVYTVADAGGLTLIEIANESSLPIAVAFDSPAVLGTRPAWGTSPAGIDLPAGSQVFPVGHHAAITVGLAHTGATALPAALPSAAAVVRGWLQAVAPAGRYVLPEQGLGDAVVAARCEALLVGPGDPQDEAVSFLVAAGQLVRLGEPAEPWVPEVAAAAERAARDGERWWGVAAALDAAAGILAAAGERRALADLVLVRDRRGPVVWPDVPPDGILAAAWVEHNFADRGARLLPCGWPDGWLGVNVEGHALPVGPATQLSLAVRWHGARPAVLWEVTGDPVTLTAPAVAADWASSAPRGEALWPAPDAGRGPLS